VEIEMPEFFLDELTTFKPGIQDTVLAKLDRLQEEGISLDAVGHRDAIYETQKWAEIRDRMTDE
jgi:hypothetical protein